MTLERRIASAFGLDDEGWARHANPWSGWTRFATVLPLLVLAVWSRVWIGPWSVFPIGLAVAWTWLNPRLFPPPPTDAAWITRGVLGERLWSRRDIRPVPPAFGSSVHLPNVVAAVGGLLVVWGLAVLSFSAALIGCALVIGGKLAFIASMVRLYDTMTATDPTLRYRPPDGDRRPPES